MIGHQYTPIVLFAFNRLEPLKHLIDSLLANKEAAESDLFVYVDGSRMTKKGEAEKVAAVQRFVKTITGFKSLNYKFSTVNKGLGPSIIEGVTEVVNNYGQVIVLEDDLIVAPGFLSYMNTMLEFYRDDARIMQITAFSTKHNIPKTNKNDVYLNRRGESWSWAIWKDRWDTIDWEVKDYETLLKNKKKQHAFNDIGSDLLGMLKDNIEGRNKSWAVRLCYSMFCQGRYLLAPQKSLVRNEGFDDDATNCSNSYNIYKYEYNATQTEFHPVKDIPYIKSIDVSANRYWTIRYRIWGKLLAYYHKIIK